MIQTLRTALTALIGALLLGGCWTSDEQLLPGAVARPFADGLFRYEKNSLSLKRAADGYYDAVETREGESPTTAVVGFEAMPELDREGRHAFAYQALDDGNGTYTYGLALVDATGFFWLEPQCNGNAKDEAAVRIATAHDAIASAGDADGECTFTTTASLKAALAVYAREAKYGTMWTRQP